MRLSKVIARVGVAGAIALVSSGNPASASNINVNGNICQPELGWMGPDLDHESTGTMNSANTPRDIECAVARSPLSAPGAAAFYVDGENRFNSTTTCTLYAYTYFGTPVASVTFTEPATPGASVTWDHFVTLPALGYYDYVSLLCTLPGTANAIPRATIYGITSVQ